MTERDAYKEGLHYTGIAFEGWNRTKKEEAKARVAEIKKRYKVRAVLVTERNGWQVYYGDDNFALVQYDTAEKLTSRLSEYDRQRKQIEEKYQQEMDDLDTWRANLQKKIIKIEKITK